MSRRVSADKPHGVENGCPRVPVNSLFTGKRVALMRQLLSVPGRGSALDRSDLIQSSSLLLCRRRFPFGGIRVSLANNRNWTPLSCLSILMVLDSGPLANAVYGESRMPQLEETPRRLPLKSYILQKETEPRGVERYA